MVLSALLSSGLCRSGNVQGETHRLTSTIFIYGENPWIEHHIHIDGNLPSDYAFITGIPYPNGDYIYNENEAQGWVWSWGMDPRGMETLGMALIVLVGRDPQDTGLDASQTEFSAFTCYPDAQCRG